MLSNLTVLLVLCFIGFPSPQPYAMLETIAYRIGFVCLAQLPLLFLLAGKNNVIGFLTGTSYERLNWMHRWFARTLFLTVTIHFGYWLKDWYPYAGYTAQEFKTNSMAYWGLIAWVFLAWITFSSFAPVRRLSYEVFVLQHLVTFSCFIGGVYMHLKPFQETHAYLWACVGIFFFDRLSRALLVLYTNISFFHPEQRRSGDMNPFWAGKAEFTPLANDTTRITINNPSISWKAGQHVFVSCHSIIPLQSHPFTIASIPEDGKIELYVKSEKGGTKRFYQHAEKSSSLPLTDGATGSQLRTVSLEGPYGRIRPLRQFDSVVLFAGTTGATFTMPLIRDIVLGWQTQNSPGTWLRPSGVVTRRIRYVWVTKSRGQVSWFSSQLSSLVEQVSRLRAEGLEIELEISIYCTCDDSFTEEHKSLLSSSNATPKFEKTVHGRVEEIDTITPSTTLDGNEKKNVAEVDERRYSAAPSTTHSTQHMCGGGTCCCQSTIEDEADADTPRAPCCCGPRASTDSEKTPSPSVSSKTPLLHPSISLFAGRPNPHNIVRKTLEEALGESAVVVCGPSGLVGSVRKSVVKLSDERAVHKGTGAQGIHLHVEEYCF